MQVVEDGTTLEEFSANLLDAIIEANESAKMLRLMESKMPMLRGEPQEDTPRAEEEKKGECPSKNPFNQAKELIDSLRDRFIQMEVNSSTLIQQKMEGHLKELESIVNDDTDVFKKYGEFTKKSQFSGASSC